MIEAQFRALRQSNSAEESLKMLTKEASRERKTINYPERVGKICYSPIVKNLVAELFSHGVSVSVIANAAGVAINTIKNWLKSVEQAPFRELRIVPTHEQYFEQRNQEEQGHSRENYKKGLEFIFPSGVRLLVERSDFDETLLSLFVRVKEA